MEGKTQPNPYCPLSFRLCFGWSLGPSMTIEMPAEFLDYRGSGHCCPKGPDHHGGPFIWDFSSVATGGQPVCRQLVCSESVLISECVS